MNLFQKSLSTGYAMGIYLVSAVYSLAAAFLCCFYPTMAPVCIVLKLMGIPIILYLFKSFQGKHTIYFYLNLGISRMEYYLIPVVVEASSETVSIRIISGDSLMSADSSSVIVRETEVPQETAAEQTTAAASKMYGFFIAQ